MACCLPYCLLLGTHTTQKTPIIGRELFDDGSLHSQVAADSFTNVSLIHHRLLVPLGLRTARGSQEDTRHPCHKHGGGWNKPECLAIVCVCPPLDKGFPSTTPIRQGAQAHRGYLCQRSCSTMGDAEIDHLRVPAELLDKLSPYFSTV